MFHVVHHIHEGSGTGVTKVHINTCLRVRTCYRHFLLLEASFETIGLADCIFTVMTESAGASETMTGP